MRKLGAFLTVCGLLGAAYFFLFFNTSVALDDGRRVNNLGLLADRQAGLLFFGLIAVLGVALYLFSPRVPDAPPAVAAAVPQTRPMTDKERAAANRIERRVWMIIGTVGAVFAAAIRTSNSWSFPSGPILSVAPINRRIGEDNAKVASWQTAFVARTVVKNRS